VKAGRVSASDSAEACVNPDPHHHHGPSASMQCPDLMNGVDALLLLLLLLPRLGCAAQGWAGVAAMGAATAEDSPTATKHSDPAECASAVPEMPTTQSHPTWRPMATTHFLTITFTGC